MNVVLCPASCISTSSHYARFPKLPFRRKPSLIASPASKVKHCSQFTESYAVSSPISIMADVKKRDDYTIEMADRGGNDFEPPKLSRPPAPPLASVANNPIFPILSYCGSSILMTVCNKYVLSGLDFNLNFFLLVVQVCAIMWVVVGSGLMKMYRRWFV